MTNQNKILLAGAALVTVMLVYYAYRKVKGKLFDEEIQNAIYAWVNKVYQDDSLTWYLNEYVSENGDWSRLRSAAFTGAENLIGRKSTSPLDSFDYSGLGAIVEKYSTIRKLPGGEYAFSIKHKGGGFDIGGFIKSVLPIATIIL